MSGNRANFFKEIDDRDNAVSLIESYFDTYIRLILEHLVDLVQQEDLNEKEKMFEFLFCLLNKNENEYQRKFSEFLTLFEIDSEGQTAKSLSYYKKIVDESLTDHDPIIKFVRENLPQETLKELNSLVSSQVIKLSNALLDELKKTELKQSPPPSP